MRAQFILSEIAIGLRRNLSMTISVVIVTMVSLFFLGAGLLFQSQVSLMKGYWYDRIQVSIFLCGPVSDAASCASGEVTPQQKDGIQADLESPAMARYVERVYFESKADAYARFKEQFKDSAIVDNTTVDQMPESFRVKLKDPEKFAVVRSAFEGRPGVETVQDQRQLLDRFFTVLNYATLGAGVLAGLMLLCAGLLVATTIRLAAFSRRRETGIMRLVGASNLFIQLPFMLEGVLAATVGALLAFAGLSAVVVLGIQGKVATQLPFTRFVDIHQVLSIGPLLLLIGVVLAGVSSLVTLRRYLKV